MGMLGVCAPRSQGLACAEPQSQGGRDMTSLTMNDIKLGGTGLNPAHGQSHHLCEPYSTWGPCFPQREILRARGDDRYEGGS